MIKNYLKVAWRNLLKNKAHTLINIVGLSVGMAVSVLIGLWIYDELTFDTYYKNHDRMVMVLQHQTFNGDVGTQNSIPIPLGTTLSQNYRADFKYVVMSTWNFDHILSIGDKKILKAGSYMSPEGPKMLTLNMLQGSREALNDMSSMLISKSTAIALFGNDDAMGKTIKIDNAWVVKIAGVYEDLPKNTFFNDVKFIAPWDLYMTTMSWLKNASTRWGNNSWQLFAQLNDNANIDVVSKKISQLKAINIAKQGDMVGASFKPVVFLYPLTRWHLHSEFKNGVNTGGRIQFVWLFGIIGILVLLLACINFMNLSTARSEKRAKEVGIRKTLGSLKSQLISQFFSESLMVSIFSFFVSLLLVLAILPWFNQVSDKEVGILWTNPYFWLLGFGFAIFTGIIAGSYPAFYLSSFQPVKVLKGTFKAGKLAALPRKILVVLQFFASATLIMGTVVVFRQVEYTKDRPVGYERTGLVEIDEKTQDSHKNFPLIRQELLRQGLIAEMAESGSPLTNIWSNNSGMNWQGKLPGQQDDFGTVPVSNEFGKVAQWKIVQGRDFSRDFATDSSAMILNEAAAKFVRFKNPIGQTINWGKDYHIVGIVKDMVMTSPYDPVKPTIFFLTDKGFDGGVIDIRINPKLSMHEALAKIEVVYKQFDPGAPFVYKFTDEEYAHKFEYEERIGKLAGFFTLLAIFISCMGLFGMASFMAEQRTKEIGVRKVLGASVFSLWRLMSTEFVLLVVVSLVIATPVAYHFMQEWLQGYKYQTPMPWWIFGGTALGAIAITVLTVSYQSLKAASANPVKSLRSE